jgi:biopolymer transport protein ExbB
MSAIPLLLLHAKLTSTTGHIVDSLEMASVKALNSISDFNKHHLEKRVEFPDENPLLSDPEPGLGTAT